MCQVFITLSAIQAVKQLGLSSWSRCNIGWSFKSDCLKYKITPENYVY